MSTRLNSALAVTPRTPIPMLTRGDSGCLRRTTNHLMMTVAGSHPRLVTVNTCLVARHHGNRTPANTSLPHSGSTACLHSSRGVQFVIVGDHTANLSVLTTPQPSLAAHAEGLPPRSRNDSRGCRAQRPEPSRPTSPRLLPICRPASPAVAGRSLACPRGRAFARPPSFSFSWPLFCLDDRVVKRLLIFLEISGR